MVTSVKKIGHRRAMLKLFCRQFICWSLLTNYQVGLVVIPSKVVSNISKN